jgi:hypothetical protein
LAGGRPEAGVTATPAGLLEVHGLTIRVEGDWDEVVQDVLRDFAWFGQPWAAPVRARLGVTISRGAPDFGSFGPLEAAFVTPRNVVYQDGARTVIDYAGRALAHFDRARGRFSVRSEDPHLAREAAYLFVLSRIGEHLDRIGLPRLHALALCSRRAALAVLLPSGGGKSVLALRALDDPAVRVLSEESPLLDRTGRLHPFPLRLGLTERDAAGAGRPVRRLERMEHASQYVVEVGAYAERVERAPRHITDIVIGRRSLGRSASLERIPRRAALVPLAREGVVGVGLYQGLEFLLQHGLGDLAGRAGTAAVRSRACGAALRRARVWRLVLGRDLERNWEVLRSLLV